MPPRPTSTASESPRLYRDLAGWFHLLTAPHEYRDEAHYYGERILEAASGQVRTVLELGSGGGNNASHMKRRFTMTLSDLSPEMLALSQRINPELEHVHGDMRSLRIPGAQFDAVFVHDAASYLASEDDVRAMAATAAFHCRPGGAVVVVPTTSARTSPRRTWSAAATTPPTGTACVSSCGPPTPIPPTRPTLPTSPTCSATPMGLPASSTTGTSSASSPRPCGPVPSSDAGFDVTVQTDPWGARVFSGTNPAA